MIESGQGYLGKLTEEPSFSLAWGRSEKDPELFYDLASLTKVIVTNSLLLQLMQDLGLTLDIFRDTKVSTFIRHLPSSLFELKIGSVWDHTAGLKAHFHLDLLKSRTPYSGTREDMWDFVLEQISEHMGDTQDLVVYSDLDYWILGAVLESHYKKNIQDLWQDFKKKHALPLNDLVFGPLKENVIPTEQRHEPGVVNDDNACFMGGVAPHAGLFATAKAVWSWMQLMQEFYDRESSHRDFFVPQNASRFWCGWDRPTDDLTQAGSGASSEQVIGHLGYTGTALWWNPETSLGGVLLTNRVFPSHSEESRLEIKKLRNRFFSVIWAPNPKDLWESFLSQVLVS